jgi:hypothetical protein
MTATYLQITMTESVRRAQLRYYGQAVQIPNAPARNPLGERETRFIAARDSFYLGSVSESGCPISNTVADQPDSCRWLIPLPWRFRIIVETAN